MTPDNARVSVLMNNLARRGAQLRSMRSKMREGFSLSGAPRENRNYLRRNVYE
jgi:hypothetical protein